MYALTNKTSGDITLKITDTCFVSRKQISFKSNKTGLLACSAFQHLPIPIIRDSGILLKNLTELTVARQPMIYTWFPFKPFLQGILLQTFE